MSASPDRGAAAAVTGTNVCSPYSPSPVPLTTVTMWVAMPVVVVVSVMVVV